MTTQPHPMLGRLGLTPASVRGALGLPPLPTREKVAAAYHYVTAEDRDRRLRELREAVPLMIGLALAGIPAEGARGIAALCGCSPSAVKARLRAADVSNPRGRPWKRHPEPVVTVRLPPDTPEQHKPTASLGGLLEEIAIFGEEKTAESLDSSGL